MSHELDALEAALERLEAAKRGRTDGHDRTAGGLAGAQPSPAGITGSPVFRVGPGHERHPGPAGGSGGGAGGAGAVKRGRGRPRKYPRADEGGTGLGHHGGGAGGGGTPSGAPGGGLGTDARGGIEPPKNLYVS